MKAPFESPANNASDAEFLMRNSLDRVEAESISGTAVLLRDRLAESEVQVMELSRRYERAMVELHRARSAAEIARAQITDLNTRMGHAVDSLRNAFPTSSSTSLQERSGREKFQALRRRIRHELTLARDRIARSTLERRAPGEQVPAVLFNSAWIGIQHPELEPVSLESYLSESRYWRIDPHPLFSATFFRMGDCTIDGREVSPLQYYVERGWREGRDPHRWFCGDWYLLYNPDVLADRRISPLEHYVTQGWLEGRKANPLFAPALYLERHPDVRSAGVEPLGHYIMHGQFEGREIPGIDVGAQARIWMPEADRHLHPFDYLLTREVGGERSEFDIEPLLAKLEPLDLTFLDLDAVSDPTWPPPPLNGYWPPQTLRDFVLDGYGEVGLNRIWYLYSVMAAFESNPAAFPASEACRLLLTHARRQAGKIARATHGIPDVSIVIPVYNNILDTLLCIVSVLDAECGYTFEIIIADDGSKDTTAEIIPTIGGCVRHVRHARNHGFLGNCNAAAAHARGLYVLLLNNDTLVMPHWLDALLDPFKRFERVGLTGAKLINWDGTLQEAGGIYWRDGSAWNFGRGQAPRAPQFSYVKDVDYVSGAAICIPSEVWLEMGGFDPLFAPAYCEDSDIAFRLRAAGYRTMLAPDAEVIHHEGRSHGRDVNSGIKAYQVANMQRQFERWQHVLERDHYPNAVNVFRARDRSFAKRHILVVDHYVPQWDQDAGSRSTFNCIEAFLALGYSVTLWPDNLWRDPDYTPVYQAMGVEVIYGGEYINNFDAFIQERADLYDAAFINRPHIAAPYIDALRAHTRTKVMFYGHDLHFQRMIRARDIGESIGEAEIEAAREMEFGICARADVVFYPNHAEVDCVAEAIGGERAYVTLPVVVYPTAIVAQARAVWDRAALPMEASLLFIGGFNHTPNRDGIIWFVKEVLPIVRAAVGSVRLIIAGSKPPSEVLALQGDGIVVTGFVTDTELARLYDEAAIAVAPLRYGAGVKGKVIEALAKGVPLATTSVGAQGLFDPEDILFLGDTPEDFAEAVIRGLSDREEARRRTAAGLDYIDQHYSFEALKALFRGLVEG